MMGGGSAFRRLYTRRAYLVTSFVLSFSLRRQTMGPEDNAIETASHML